MLEVKEGDNFPDKCCAGFDWEVRLIFPDEKHPGYTEFWGRCHNPDCPDYQDNIGPDDPYRGISTICLEDLEEWLEERETA